MCVPKRKKFSQDDSFEQARGLIEEELDIVAVVRKLRYIKLVIKKYIRISKDEEKELEEKAMLSLI